jgi:ribosomal protein S4
VESPGSDVSRLEEKQKARFFYGVRQSELRGLDRAALKGIVRRLPQRAEFQAPFDETQIIEFHSR